MNGVLLIIILINNKKWNELFIPYDEYCIIGLVILNMANPKRPN